MKNFPQELVDQVIEELFVLVGRRNAYSRPPKRRGYRTDSLRFVVPTHGISSYTLVSKAWVDTTQKHHFSTLSLDRDALDKWCTRIAPDPAGISRHVRKLVLNGLKRSDFTASKKHLLAFTRVESLMIRDCSGISELPPWLSLMGSCLVELRMRGSQASSHTITSLLATLPLLQDVDIKNFTTQGGADKTKPTTPSRIPFFEGANRLTLRPDMDGLRHHEGALDWVPPSARFSQLDIDRWCLMYRPDLVNRWFASSCATLTNLTIGGEPSMTLNEQSAFANLSSCTALESLQIPPVSSIIGAVLPHVNSSRLAKVTLRLDGWRARRTLPVGGRSWEGLEEHLCRLARRFKDSHPGRKMEVGITGYFGECSDGYRIHVLGILNRKSVMLKLKEEAKVVFPSR